MCVWILNRLLPLLCCGLTWERLNIRRKSFFSSSSGVLSICSAEYGVVKGVVGAEGEAAFLFPRTAGGERLRSLIILLLFLFFRVSSSSRWASVVRPHTRRKSTFFGEREIWAGEYHSEKKCSNLVLVYGVCLCSCTSEDVFSLSGGCSVTLLKWAFTSSSSLSSYDSSWS